MLQELAANQLWVADMPASRLGFEFGARMTIVRLSSGDLFIHSPIELDATLKRELDALGAVRYVVSPYRMHFMHLLDFAQAYPEARFYASPGLGQMEGVTFDGVLGDKAEPEWAADLEQVVIRGNVLDNEVDFFHRASRTLILTDLCFNIPSERSLTTRVMARFLGVLETCAPTRTFRLLTRNRVATRKCIEHILAWDFDRIILAHGKIVESGGKMLLRTNFSWLLGR
jgi:hypothetical protein